MSRHALLVGLALLGFGCARSRAVAFQGHSSEPRVDVERVRETSVMPREASWLGRVIARCQPFTADGSFEDRALFDLDCSERRLRALLREGAADAGGNVLSEVVCNSGSTRECRALVSHLAGLAAQEATPLEPALRSVVGDARVSFWARTKLPPARSNALVSEQPLALPSHVPLGCVRVQCEACSELEARDALHVAAARLGAKDVVSPHCASVPSGTECEAELARFERDE